MTIINAFHPDYIKTHHPEMLNKLDVLGRENGMLNLPAPKAGVAMRGALSKSKATPVSLKPLEFMYYSKAGTKNTVVKHKAKK